MPHCGVTPPHSRGAQVVAKLSQLVLDGKPEVRDIYGTCLKGLFAELPASRERSRDWGAPGGIAGPCSGVAFSVHKNVFAFLSLLDVCCVAASYYVLAVY